MKGLKPYKVDQVIDGRNELDIFFDRDKKEFFAAIGMERVTHTDINEAKKLARELLKKAPKYEWERVIVVSGVPDEHEMRLSFKDIINHEVNVHFSFQRIERARDPMGKKGHVTSRVCQYERPTEEDFNENLEAYVARFYPRERKKSDEIRAEWRKKREENRELSSYYDGGGIVLPYAEATWQGLLSIKAVFDNAREKLDAFLVKDDLSTRLAMLTAGSAALALGAGGPNTKPALGLCTWPTGCTKPAKPGFTMCSKHQPRPLG
jgi:hypothetical protein